MIRKNNPVIAKEILNPKNPALNPPKTGPIMFPKIWKLDPTPNTPPVLSEETLLLMVVKSKGDNAPKPNPSKILIGMRR